ncbi:hypothetical protein K474DRAFT_81699 [Panus rudis PR-1116 ss-1]|nr:hypothetical protein K474DRAFT_81699 [Panus rudis PR-1116 ss-1]
MPQPKRRKANAANLVAVPPTTTLEDTAANDATKSSNSSCRRRGRLQDLPKMPLDIIFEIFSHLLPSDLLNLARTTKAFRQLLMSKQSAAHWRAARANVPGLPDIPDDMAEPAFANLLFDMHCHGCLKPSSSEPIWVFRKRYCSDCKLANIIPVVQLLKYEVFGQCFRSKITPVPSAVLAVNVNGQRRDIVAVHKPELFLFHALLEHSVSPDKRDAFIKQWQKSSQHIVQQSAAFSAWYADRKRGRQDELEKIRNSRFDAITQKLRELGWGPALDHLSQCAPNNASQHPLQSLSIVKIAKPFSLRTWPRIYKEILPMLEIAEKERLKAERKQLMKARLEILAQVIDEFRVYSRHFLPGIREFVSFPEFASIIRAPSDVTVTKEMFRALQHHVPEIVKNWEETQREKLSEEIRNILGVPSDVNPLNLAIGTYFLCQCGDCPLVPRDSRLWPHTIRSAVAHSSAEVAYKKFSADEEAGVGQTFPDLDAAALPELPDLLECPQPKEFEFEREKLTSWIPKLVSKLVKMCGLDPLSTTTEQYDSLRARFVCRVCSIDKKTVVFNWRAAGSKRCLTDDYRRDSVHRY